MLQKSRLTGSADRIYAVGFWINCPVQKRAVFVEAKIVREMSKIGNRIIVFVIYKKRLSSVKACFVHIGKELKMSNKQ